MEKIPTAKKLINSKERSDEVFLSNGNYYYSEYIDLKKVRKLMIEFAKLHVEAALKEASVKASVYADEGGYSEFVDEDSILNSYPLDKIK
jgi:hypothetical protein